MAVFCGSRAGANAAHAQAARDLGAALAAHHIGLVYGGGSFGLMGILADSVLAHHGTITGVIPDFLRDREVAHHGVINMVSTPTMHTRKQTMLDLSNALVMLPGGLGTLDETIEILTWAALGLHQKPIFFCDIAGSARGLLGAIDAAIADDFTAANVRDLYTVVQTIPDLIAALCAKVGSTT